MLDSSDCILGLWPLRRYKWNWDIASVAQARFGAWKLTCQKPEWTKQEPPSKYTSLVLITASRGIKERVNLDRIEDAYQLMHEDEKGSRTRSDFLPGIHEAIELFESWLRSDAWLLCK